MAERAAGSCEAAESPGPRPSGGSSEEVSAGGGPGPAEGAAGRPRRPPPNRFSPQRSPGGARPAAGGVVSDPDPGERKADPKQFLKPPDVAAVSQNISPCETTGAATRKTSHKSPSPRKSPLVTTPQAKRRSWCRSSLKGTKHRKSLPPVHQDVTDLSKSISLDLPETDRLSMLLLSSFQFSAQKFEHVLKQTDGFSPEAFKANVHSLSEELKRYLQKLKRDGTLKSCIEDPKGILLDAALDESVAQVKEYIARFAAECQSWDRLLLRHRESAEEMSRQLEERRRRGGQAEPPPSLPTSQAAVLGSKPDYQRLLDEQGEVVSCVELALDELQQAVKVLQAFSEDSRQYLRHLSEQLATRTFRQLENSPVRRLIAAPPRKTPPPEG
ncbi:kinetochore-associated protein DSN1 homolog [Gavia stellata]|uniref:kinetochore-associated protein DSN1 homolog n=1 Tax=Gavia stellata TaxID=37040 RepID=UPI0028A01F80|nr:kinetochore-associated protein DSN1 homolog [Gavia stellata]